VSRFRDRLSRLHLLTLAVLLAFGAGSVTPDIVLGSSLDSYGSAGYPGEFLRYGVSVRSMGFGMANVALADDPSGIYYNPAAIIRNDNKLSFYVSHYQPFNTSGFLFGAVSKVGSYTGDSGVQRFFLGPNTALGFAFLDLSSDGYQHRSVNNQLLDEDFGLFQQAFMLNLAREWVGTRGVLGYGFNLKYIRQGVSGADYGIDDISHSDGALGLDVGAQVQMINPWLLKKVVSLKRLMPFRMGLNIQNLVAPKVGLSDGFQEKYPTILRWGVSYRFEGDYTFMPRSSRMYLLLDFEWMFEDASKIFGWDRGGQRDHGTYFGTEAQIDWGKAVLALRLGNRLIGDDSNVTAGFGVTYPIQGMKFTLDLARGWHDLLDNDFRIAFTIRPGTDRDAGHLFDKYFPTKQVRHLKVLAEAPNEKGRKAAEELRISDPENVIRYNMFLGGQYEAYGLYLSMLEEIARNQVSEANTYATQADGKYDGAYVTDADDFTTEDYLNWGETLLVEGYATSGKFADAQTRSSLARPSTPEESLRQNFQMGVSHLNRGDAAKAAPLFREALQSGAENQRSMLTLSRYALGHCQLLLGDFDAAIASFAHLVDEAGIRLASDHPRFNLEGSSNEWRFTDSNLVDDSMYYLGECHLRKASPSREEARIAFASVGRYFPRSPYAARARSKLVGIGGM